MTTRLVAIDGPAGCGKSTVSRELAKALDGVMFSSGTVYRGVTLLALDERVDLQKSEEILAVLDRHQFEVVEEGHELKLRIDGKDRGSELHGSEVTREIHWIADDATIRDRLLPIQRELADRPFSRSGAVVVEGRDIGTVVFPDAAAKVFLTATPEERVRRRGKQLRTEIGETVDQDRVRADVERRDRYDTEREAAPLRAAEDAMVVDTTGLSIVEVVDKIVSGLPWKPVVRRNG